MVGLYAEGPRRQPHALFAPDARLLILVKWENHSRTGFARSLRFWSSCLPPHPAPGHKRAQEFLTLARKASALSKCSNPALLWSCSESKFYA